MTFLRLCLWICVATLGVGQLRVQQTLTPEQQKQAAEALRRALEQAPGAAPTPAVPPPAEAKPPPPSETKPIAPAEGAAPAAVPADPKAAEKARKEAEARTKAEA